MTAGGFNVQPAFGDRAPRSIRGGASSADLIRDRSYGLAPRVPWDVFVSMFEWNQGEHVGLIGPTGQGKTNLLMNLLPLRTYNVVFATKPRDSSMDRLINTGYVKMENWSSIPPERSPRRVLWPNASTIDADERQRDVFGRAFRMIYTEGGWTLVVDEGFYVADLLGLKREMKMMWTQGRALGISFTVATQRPAWVPREMYDGSTHMFFWRITDRRDVQNIQSMGAAPTEVVTTLVQNLEQFQCLYVNTRTGQMLRTRTPAPR